MTPAPAGDALPLTAGDVLHVPLAPDLRTPGPRVRRLIVADVLHTAAGVTYCFRDQRGPAILIRQARLRWLQARFERELHASGV